MSGDVRAPIAVTGWSIHVPGSRLAAALGSAPDPLSCAPESAHELLGRRGLLNKEPATRLALCAVHRAIGRPPGAAREPGPPDSRVAVVASSNLGNVATVQTIARTLRTTGLKDVSALDAPNASSNVLASTVAIWFRCGGPNLMICSGATSGLDAVYLARVLLLADRADRVIVVGAEPGDPVAVSLHARRAAPNAGALLPGAAALVLERADRRALGVPLIDSLPRTAWRPDQCGENDSAGDAIVIGPAALGWRVHARRTIDIVRDAGDPYGALGVIQLAVAAELVASSPWRARQQIIVSCGDDTDGWRSAVIVGQRVSQEVPDVEVEADRTRASASTP